MLMGSANDEWQTPLIIIFITFLRLCWILAEYLVYDCVSIIFWISLICDVITGFHLLDVKLFLFLENWSRKSDFIIIQLYGTIGQCSLISGIYMFLTFSIEIGNTNKKQITKIYVERYDNRRNFI
jgi:hypothetical protein